MDKLLEFEWEQWCLFALTAAAVPGLALVGTGCGPKTKVGEVGESIEEGGIEVQVEDYEIRNLELVEDGKTFEYEEPVLAIPIVVKNVGDDAFMYNPTHRSQKMTESTTPLMYYDPGEEASLPPSDKTPVNGVYLEEGNLEEQVTEQTRIEPGKSIQDVLLFEIPSEDKEKLILSIPPEYHRGNKPVLFRMSYTYEEPSGGETPGKGETVDVDGVEFTVQELSTEYIKLEETRDGRAYSSSPLVKVAYQIKNTTDGEVTYAPKHQNDSVRRTPVLRSNGDVFRPVEFPLKPKIVEQQEGQKALKSGEKVEDFTVFQRPPKKVKALTFTYPASRFDRGGVLEFQVPYSYEEPDKPDETEEEDE
jgi:hypothetical protein